MFLNKNNSLKYKRIIIASVAATFLCLIGVLWLDAPIYLFLREFNWRIWEFFDIFFATKVWLGGAALIALIIFIKKFLKSKDNVAKSTKKFNLRKYIDNFIQKSKYNSGFLIFCSIFAASVFAAILKWGVGRQRPIFFEALGQTGFYPFTNEWAFNSMPSGHTVSSFAGLVMIGLLFPKIKWATWTLAIVIGISRIAYGAHWPSDVLLGAFIGMLTADLVKYLFFKK